MEKLFDYEFKSNMKYHVVLYPNRIEITPKGTMNLMNKGVTGTIIISLKNLTAMEYKEGYLEFITGGLNHIDSTVKKVQSDNVITVKKGSNDDVMLEALKNKICELM